MKFFKSSFSDNEQLRLCFLLIGLFVLLPLFFSFTEDLSGVFFDKKNGCFLSFEALISFHCGLFLIKPLSRLLSWKQTYFITLFFLPIEIIFFVFHYSLGISIIDGFIIFGAYNSLYLLTIKNIIDPHESIIINSIAAISGVLIACLTLLAGFFAYATCIYPFFE